MPKPARVVLVAITVCASVLSGFSLTNEEVASRVQGMMDLSADPCTDFYRYACGKWMDGFELPADKSGWTYSLSTIYESNRAVLRSILEDAGKNPGADPDRKRVGDFYASCMDEVAIEAADDKPLAPWLKQVAEMKDTRSFMTLVGAMTKSGGNPLLTLYVLSDVKNPTNTIAYITQGGLGLPERDYYLSDEPQQKQLRDGYRKYLEQLFTSIGEEAAKAALRAEQVMRFETALARVSRPVEELRDAEKNYNKLDRIGLKKLSPKLDWDNFFAAVGAPGLTQLSVGVPEFFTGAQALIESADIDTLKSYLVAQLVIGSAPGLSKRFADSAFEFFGKQLSGQREQEPRWKRCVDSTQGYMGEMVGKLYVAERFAGDSKTLALEMVGDIEDAFARRLPGLEWMDETTREAALQKKAKIQPMIGYPDKWKDYSALKLRRNSYFENLVATSQFLTAREIKKVGKPVDRQEWSMLPQTVNAGYSPARNRITFPAGILQPPMFHKDFPAAMNFGAIGSVIGHELTHGFDDEGRKFDGDGKLREWWAPAVSERFEQRARCVQEQYAGYEAEPGLKLNGTLTLGENIADNGGVKQSFAAFKSYQQRHHNAGASLAGLTADQLFFVAFAQVWCEEKSAEALRLQVRTDPHSPGRYRVIGTVVNSTEFANAFQCAPTTRMNPHPKCQVW